MAHLRITVVNINFNRLTRWRPFILIWLATDFHQVRQLSSLFVSLEVVYGVNYLLRGDVLIMVFFMLALTGVVAKRLETDIVLLFGRCMVSCWLWLSFTFNVTVNHLAFHALIV
jgi:hypothetical protein